MNSLYLAVGGFVALLLVGLAALYIGDLFSKRRMNALARTAELLGLSRACRQAHWPEGALENIAMRRRGGSDKVIRNVLRGRLEELDVLVFDYRYVLASNSRNQGIGPRANARDVYDQTVVLWSINGTSLPRFELRATDYLHAKTGRFENWQDITIPDELGLGRHYLLRGEQEAEVSSLLCDGLAEIAKQREDLCVDAGGEWIAVYRQNDLVAPGQLGDLVKDAAGVVEFLRRRAGRPQSG